MNLKRIAVGALLLGIVLFAVSLAMPIVYLEMMWKQPDVSVSLVGGADAPTYQYVVSSVLDGLPYVLALFGIGLMIAAGFCLLFSKTVQKHCSIKTSAIALTLSGVGAVGLGCALNCFAIFAFSNPAKYPIEFPGSVLLGMICLIGFVVLIAQYFKVRETNWSAKGLVIDVLTSILFLPAFFYAFSYIMSMIT